MLESVFFFYLSTLGYFISFVFYLLYSVLDPSNKTATVQVPSGEALGITATAGSFLIARRMDWGRLATCATFMTVAVATIGVVLRVIEIGIASDWVMAVFLPVTTTYETLTFLSWVIPLAYLMIERRFKIKQVGVFVTAVAFIMLSIAALPRFAPSATAPLVPALQSYWLVIHVLFMMVGISFFSVGFGASALLLIEHYRGGTFQKKLEEMSYVSNALGFPFYGIGGLIFGGIWAKYAWGAYWEWGPKETAMLIAWLTYAVYLHARLRWGPNSLIPSWLSVIAYTVVLFAWIGINYLVGGLHSFN